MQVELPDDVVSFMRELAKEIKTQDNRMTRSPYFYVVQGGEVHASMDGCGEETVYVKDGEVYSMKQIKEHYKEEYEGVESFDDYLESEYKECEIGYHDIENNVFFTEKGYNQHMKLNGHNYRTWKDPHSYVKYASRNPEIEGLYKAIMAFDVENKVG